MASSIEFCKFCSRKGNSSSSCAKCLNLCSSQKDKVCSALEQEIFPKYTGIQSLSLPISLPVCLLIREKIFHLLFSQEEIGFTGGLKETFKGLLPTSCLPLTANPQESDLSIQITFQAAEQSERDFEFLKSLLEPQDLPRKNRHQSPPSNALVEHLFSQESTLKAIQEQKSKIIEYFSHQPIGNVDFSFGFQARGNSVFIAGKYCKLERGISQTPWIIGGKNKTEFSVSGIIEQTLSTFIRFSGSKFCSAGREDADVRMLGEGRPFLLELLDVQNLDKVRELCQAKDSCLLQSEFESNSKYSHLVTANSLRIVDGAKANALLKKGEEEKSKTYSCLIWTSKANCYLNDGGKVGKLDSMTPVKITQRTPIRVLQRRALMDRVRQVTRMKTIPIDEHHFKLELDTEAGTYIKEFVHGDFGRTRPSVGTLLGGEVDILELDVLSVHLSEW